MFEYKVSDCRWIDTVNGTEAHTPSGLRMWKIRGKKKWNSILKLLNTHHSKRISKRLFVSMLFRLQPLCGEKGNVRKVRKKSPKNDSFFFLPFISLAFISSFYFKWKRQTYLIEYCRMHPVLETHTRLNAYIKHSDVQTYSIQSFHQHLSSLSLEFEKEWNLRWHCNFRQRLTKKSTKEKVHTMNSMSLW